MLVFRDHHLIVSEIGCVCVAGAYARVYMYCAQVGVYVGEYMHLCVPAYVHVTMCVQLYTHVRRAHV